MTAEAATLEVALGDRTYPIHIGAGLIDRAGALIAPILRQPRVVVVTDVHLEATGYPGRLRRALEAAGVRADTVVMPAGETTKSMTKLEELLERILALEVERKVTLIALGGGVIGDLAGFAAAILLRGVDLIQVPTTLLAQVDSSVGGKTGVNSRHGKNLIGAFHQPRAVMIDVDVLDGLPPREVRAGYAEVVKHGCIRDRAFFAWLEANGPRLLEGDAAARIEAVRRSLEIKAEIVRCDERETSGLRALLNFGHTFAHAYEALSGYESYLLHGEAVSLGMVKAATLSARLGLAAAEDGERLRRHLEAVGLPVTPGEVRHTRFGVNAMLDAMRKDKKVAEGRLNFVLWRGIGDGVVRDDVDMPTLQALLAEDA